MNTTFLQTLLYSGHMTAMPEFSCHAHIVCAITGHCLVPKNMWASGRARASQSDPKHPICFEADSSVTSQSLQDVQIVRWCVGMIDECFVGKDHHSQNP